MTLHSILRHSTLKRGVLGVGELRSLVECKYVCSKRELHCDNVKYAVAGKLASNQRPDWNRAVTEAEKVVGYPTSFLNLRWLLSDEIANVALHLRKLVGSNHPLLRTAKSFLYNGRNNMQAWGLIVLLVSKAGGHINVDAMEEDKAAGLLHSQRALAEITEMIRTSNLVHKALVNVTDDMFIDQNEAKDDMLFGNKIALLSGDYLLVSSSSELATLRNHDVSALMSCALRDLSQGEFVGRRDNQHNPLPSIGVSAIEDWTRRHTLMAGSLLGKSCQSTLKLANHSSDFQKIGYNFGKHLALAWQAYVDLEPFTGSSFSLGQKFSLIAAPVLFHLEHDPTLGAEIDKGTEDVKNVNYYMIHNIVSKGPGIEMTKKLQQDHTKQALEMLSHFKGSDAQTALKNIILAMGDP